jgi:putative tryptophan/tyrosine transport system substrate-binding protein
MNNNRKIYTAVLVFVIFFALSFSVPADAFKKVVVIVTMPVPACEAHLRSFVSQLTELGYKNGENMALTIIRANGDREFAETELQKVMKAGRPDAVAAIATLASQAAVKVLKDTDVPVFFFQVADPVGAGLVEKIGEPTGTNVSGRVFTVPAEVRINLAMRLAGQTIPEKRPVRFGYIHSTYPSAMGDMRALTAIEKNRTDIVFDTYEIPYKKVPQGVPEMLAKALEGIHTLSDTVDFWWEPQGPLGELEEFTRLLLDHSSVPVAMGQTMESVKMGALIHITPDLAAGGQEAAKLVDGLLRGADPGTIPVTAPAKFTLGINIATAQRLHIVVPPDILELAGDNVYR